MVTSLTTDRDYLEIVEKGDVTISTVGGGDSDADPIATESGSVTITHDIGDVPLVRVYYDSAKNGRLYNTKGNVNNLINPWVTQTSTTTTTKLIVNSLSSQTNIPVHYRIYRFGTKGVTTDEDLDKIFTSGLDDQTLAAAGSSVSPTVQTVTIPHGQSEAPLHTLEFSSNNETWYSSASPLYGNPDTSSGPPGGPYSIYYYVSATSYTDDTNLYIVYEHNYPSSQTIYTRYVLDYKE